MSEGQEALIGPPVLHIVRVHLRSVEADSMIVAHFKGDAWRVTRCPAGRVLQFVTDISRRGESEWMDVTLRTRIVIDGDVSFGPPLGGRTDQWATNRTA